MAWTAAAKLLVCGGPLVWAVEAQLLYRWPSVLLVNFCRGPWLPFCLLPTASPAWATACSIVVFMDWFWVVWQWLWVSGRGWNWELSWLEMLWFWITEALWLLVEGPDLIFGSFICFILSEFEVFEFVNAIPAFTWRIFYTANCVLDRISDEAPLVDFDTGPWLFDPPCLPPACSTPLILLTTDVFLLNWAPSRLFELGPLVVFPIIYGALIFVIWPKLSICFWVLVILLVKAWLWTPWLLALWVPPFDVLS